MSTMTIGPDETQADDRMLSAPEVASMLSVSLETVEKLKTSGQLPSVKIRNSRRFRLFHVRLLMANGTPIEKVGQTSQSTATTPLSPHPQPPQERADIP